MGAAVARAPDATVVLLAELDGAQIDALLVAYGARLEQVPTDSEIPGSYWKDTEAGLIGNIVYVRADTPAHSFLHELSHFICMDDARRAALATDAGGTDEEECGVCYLQVLLAHRLDGFGTERCLGDMDAWGYSFREGSARAWFEGDGVYARAWLLGHGVVDSAGSPTQRLRI
ncbi:MAG: hypothetical protein ABI640_00795 [Gammaproteobacteria bacterium]